MQVLAQQHDMLIIFLRWQLIGCCFAIQHSLSVSVIYNAIKPNNTDCFDIDLCFILFLNFFLYMKSIKR